MFQISAMINLKTKFEGLFILKIDFYRIRVKKYRYMRVLKNKREIQNYEKLRGIGLFLLQAGFFWCNMRVSHKLQALYARGNTAITVEAVQGRMVIVNLE